MLDDLQRIVLVEENHCIDKAQSGKEFSPFVLRLDRSVRPFDDFHGAVRVHRNDKVVAHLAGGIQVAHVPWMKQIKTAVGENDPLSLRLERLDLFLEGGKVLNFLSVIFHDRRLSQRHLTAEAGENAKIMP